MKRLAYILSFLAIMDYFIWIASNASAQEPVVEHHTGECVAEETQLVHPGETSNSGVRTWTALCWVDDNHVKYLPLPLPATRHEALTAVDVYLDKLYGDTKKAMKKAVKKAHRRNKDNETLGAGAPMKQSGRD